MKLSYDDYKNPKVRPRCSLLLTSETVDLYTYVYMCLHSLALMCMELQLLTWVCVQNVTTWDLLVTNSVICMLIHVHDPTSYAGFVCENAMLMLHCKLSISSLQCWPEWHSSVQMSLRCCRWSTTWQQIRSHFYFPRRLIKMHVRCACFSS